MPKTGPPGRFLGVRRARNREKASVPPSVKPRLLVIVRGATHGGDVLPLRSGRLIGWTLPIHNRPLIIRNTVRREVP